VSAPIGYVRVRQPVEPPHVSIANGKLPVKRAATKTSGPGAPMSMVADRYRAAALHARQHVAGCAECQRRIAGQIADVERLKAWLAGSTVYTGARCPKCLTTGRVVRDGSCWGCRRKRLAGREFIRGSKSGYSADTQQAHAEEAAARVAGAGVRLREASVARHGYHASGECWGDGRLVVRLVCLLPVNGVFGAERVLIDDPHFEQWGGVEIARLIEQYGGAMGALSELLYKLKGD
jgi:hypothetical protein